MSPWLTIWRRPHDTILRVIEDDPRQWVLGLCFLMGLVQMLGLLRWSGLTCESDFLDLLFVVALIGPLFGLVAIHLAALANHLVARMLHGTAEFRATLAATAWPMAPIAVFLPFLLLNVFRHRDEFFCAPDIAEQGIFPGNGVTTLLLALAWIAAIFLSPVLISAVHRFSILRGISTMLLAQLFLQLAVGTVVGVIVAAVVVFST